MGSSVMEQIGMVSILDQYGGNLVNPLIGLVLIKGDWEVHRMYVAPVIIIIYEVIPLLIKFNCSAGFVFSWIIILIFMSYAVNMFY